MYLFIYVIFIKGCVLKIFNKDGSKLKTELHSKHIGGIEILQSKDISCEHQLYFKLSLTTKDPPVCLYAELYEEVFNWVASLLVAVSKGMNNSNNYHEDLYTLNIIRISSHCSIWVQPKSVTLFHDLNRQTS